MIPSTVSYSPTGTIHKFHHTLILLQFVDRIGLFSPHFPQCGSHLWMVPQRTMEEPAQDVSSSSEEIWLPEVKAAVGGQPRLAQDEESHGGDPLHCHGTQRAGGHVHMMSALRGGRECERDIG